MSAVLRSYGTDFDVDSFLTDCSLPVCAVKRRGQPVHPASQPDGRRHDRSGVNVSASDADFNHFPQQVEDVIEFLRLNSEQIRRLCKFPGVEEVGLDFGIAWRDTAMQSDCLPPELLRLVGALGLDIEISHYPIAEAMPEVKSDVATDE